jgi:hypothetical protein
MADSIRFVPIEEQHMGRLGDHLPSPGMLHEHPGARENQLMRVRVLLAAARRLSRTAREIDDADEGSGKQSL